MKFIHLIILFIFIIDYLYYTYANFLHDYTVVNVENAGTVLVPHGAPKLGRGHEIGYEINEF